MKKFSELFEKKKGDPCWKGYTQVGMKKKNGKEVPNCVPADGVEKAKGYKESADIEEGYYNVIVRDKNGKVNSEKRFNDKAAAQRHVDRIKKVNKVGDKPSIVFVNENLQEKSVSQAQQKMMGMALAYKRGEMDDASPEVKKMANSMSMKDLEDFAKTKHKGLPAKKEGVEENRMSPLQQIRLKKEKEDRKKKNDNSSDQYQRMKKKQYGGMMGGLKKEEVELDEAKIKVVKGDKERMITKQELRTYKQMGWSVSEEKVIDELSINTLKSYRKKAVDDVASNKKADQRAKGVAKASNKIYRKEFDALYKKESVELDEAKEHPAYNDLMKLAKDLDGRDTRAIQVMAGKISNFTATGNRGNIADLAKYFKALDSYPRDAFISVMQKHDKALLKSIAAKAGFGIKEEVEVDEAKGTGVKKFVRGMRVAKTSNPNMKGTVIKGGDNLKNAVEVEWDSGTTTLASGKYLMSIKKNESVKLGEAKISVGDRVTLKPNKNTLDQSLIGKAGVVTGMVGSKPTVKFANGKTIAVSPKDLTINESVEVDEGAFKGVGKYLAKRKFAKNSKQAVKDAEKSLSKLNKYPFYDVKNREPHEKDFIDKMKKSDRYDRAAKRLNREEVELDEGRNEALKALEGLAKKGGIDKATFQKAHDLYKETKFKELKTLISRSDTDPSEAIASVIQRHDSKAFNSMYPRAKAGDYLRNITKESVQPTFFTLREARRDAALNHYVS